jgi:Ca2+-binding EF-hand superfamily protein
MEEEIDEMIRLADAEGDGQVNWISFLRFVSGMVKFKHKRNNFFCYLYITVRRNKS